MLNGVGLFLFNQFKQQNNAKIFSTSIFKTTPIEYLLNTEINTGLTYKGNIVYKGDRGGYYYYSTNKEGQRYKRYLTPAQKSKLGLQ